MNDQLAPKNQQQQLVLTEVVTINWWLQKTVRSTSGDRSSNGHASSAVRGDIDCKNSKMNDI